MGRKVLVTGGSGFIGSYILRRLAEGGDAPVNFDAREPGPEAAWWLGSAAAAIPFVRGDIADWASVLGAVEAHRPDAIVHLAAIGSPVALARRPGLALDVNLHGTYHVLEAARLFGVARVVYFSSVSVLPGIRYQPVDADHPILLATEGPGASFYAASKVASEALCWGYRQSFGLDFIILRPSAVYGFGMQYPIFVKPMVEDALAGRPTRFAQGREFPRDYTHADDVAQLAVRALGIAADRVRDRVFFGATGRPLVTAGEVAALVGELIPEADIAIGAGLSDDDLLEIRYRGVLSIANAEEQLGYRPRFADMRLGLADYIAARRRYLDHAASGGASA